MIHLSSLRAGLSGTLGSQSLKLLLSQAFLHFSWDRWVNEQLGALQRFLRTLGSKKPQKDKLRHYWRALTKFSASVLPHYISFRGKPRFLCFQVAAELEFPSSSGGAVVVKSTILLWSYVPFLFSVPWWHPEKWVNQAAIWTYCAVSNAAIHLTLVFMLLDNYVGIYENMKPASVNAFYQIFVQILVSEILITIILNFFS